MVRSEIEESKFCTFYLGGYFFGVPVEFVQEVLLHQAMTRIPMAPGHIRGLINLRGQIVTAIDLRRLLRLPDRADTDLPMNVVIRQDGAAVSLLVDDIDEVVETRDEGFEAAPRNVDAAIRGMIKGVCKFDDRLMLLLDVDELMERAGRSDSMEAGLTA